VRGRRGEDCGQCARIAVDVGVVPEHTARGNVRCRLMPRSRRRAQPAER
jgi:hypothetical protein